MSSRAASSSTLTKKRQPSPISKPKPKTKTKTTSSKPSSSSSPSSSRVAAILTKLNSLESEAAGGGGGGGDGSDQHTPPARRHRRAPSYQSRGYLTGTGSAPSSPKPTATTATANRKTRQRKKATTTRTATKTTPVSTTTATKKKLKKRPTTTTSSTSTSSATLRPRTTLTTRKPAVPKTAVKRVRTATTTTATATTTATITTKRSTRAVTGTRGGGGKVRMKVVKEEPVRRHKRAPSYQRSGYLNGTDSAPSSPKSSVKSVPISPKVSALIASLTPKSSSSSSSSSSPATMTVATTGEPRPSRRFVSNALSTPSTTTTAAATTTSKSPSSLRQQPATTISAPSFTTKKRRAAPRRGGGGGGAARFKAKLVAQDTNARHVVASVHDNDGDDDRAATRMRGRTTAVGSANAGMAVTVDNLSAVKLKSGRGRSQTVKQSSPSSPSSSSSSSTVVSKLKVKTSSLRLVDEDALANALQALGGTTDMNEVCWVLVDALDGDMLSYNVCGGECDGDALTAIRPHLRDDCVQFVLLRVEVLGQWKVCMVVWLGDAAKGIHKAKSGPQRVHLTEFAHRYVTVATQMTVVGGGEYDDITIAHIRQRIQGIKGGRVGSTATATATEQLSLRALDTAVVERQRARDRKANAERYSVAGNTRTDMEFDGKDALKVAVERMADPHVVAVVCSVAVAVAAAAESASGTAGGGDGVCVDGVVTDDEWVVGVGFSEQWKTTYLRADAISVLLLKVTSGERGYGVQSKCVYGEWMGKVPIRVAAKTTVLLPSIEAYITQACPLPIVAKHTTIRRRDQLTYDSVMEAWSGTRQRGDETTTPKSRSSSSSLSSPSSALANFSSLGKSRGELIIEPVDIGEHVGKMVLKEGFVRADDVDSVCAVHPAWMMFGMHESRPNVLCMLEQGAEDTYVSMHPPQPPSPSSSSPPSPSYTKHFKEDTIRFVFHRVLTIPSHLRDVHTRSAVATTTAAAAANAAITTTVYTTPTYGVIVWMGDRVPVMDKAMSSHHLKHLCEVLRDVAGRLDATVHQRCMRVSDVKEFTWAALAQSLGLDPS